MDRIYDALVSMDYKNVLKYFADISAIPRGSGNMSGISRYLEEFARTLKLRCIRDEKQNVIIYKPAGTGCEGCDTVILQGHMDMVCVKTRDSDHDFLNDGLDLFVENGMLGARGTSLGGDDGIALAYGMALLADDSIALPPLEIVFTSDEETGMDGIEALDMSLLKGRYLINCDSEEEGIILCSCAGGMDVEASFIPEWKETGGELTEIIISGLNGGHSGTEIDKNRTNAIILAARILSRMTTEFDLCSFEGGVKNNAIPSEAVVSLLLHGDIKEAEQEFNSIVTAIKDELRSSEPGLCVSFATKGHTGRRVISSVQKDSLITSLLLSIDGVQTMSADISGLVESSLNLGMIYQQNGVFYIRHMLRSSCMTYLGYMRDKLERMYELVGFSCVHGSGYPAWEYRKESILRKTYERLYINEYGEKPVFSAVHAGLECGLISRKAPYMDMISIGPDMKNVHSANERLDVQSSIRLYRFLEKLLIAMTQPDYCVEASNEE